MRAILRNCLLALADVVCLFCAWALALWSYRAFGFGHYKFGYDFYLRLWPVLPGFVALNALFRLYGGSLTHPFVPLEPVEELRRLIGSSVMTHLGVLAALAIAYQTTEHYSRAAILIAGFLTAVFTQPVRDLIRLVLKRLDLAQVPVVLLGEAASRERLARTFAKNAYLGLEVAERADKAVVCGDFRLLKDALSGLAQQYTHIAVVPEGVEFPVFGTHAVAFDGRGGLVMTNRRKIRMLRLAKWILDMGLATCAFVALGPLFVVIPILVKLTSRGSVFFRQERLGRGGLKIRVWKFRSMYADAETRLQTILASDPVRKAEWEANFKLRDDPRVTAFGRFLRKSSLDELPQLFNVFAGEMALVGPRPIVEKEVPYYGSDYEVFASVKPGVTGLWQVSGRSDVDYVRRVALDMHYIRNWSPWMDLWIIFRTVYAVLFMRGAR